MKRRKNFIEAQRRMLDRYEVDAQSVFVDVPSVKGRAHALIVGEGPAVLMISGIGTPGAMWAPLIAKMNKFQLFAIDLPAYGLTDSTGDFAEDLRFNAVRFLDHVVKALGLKRPTFIANSLGSLWASWLALDRPNSVAALVHVGCPAIVLGTSAPLPMRLLSVKYLGPLLMRLQPPSEKQVEELAKMVNEYPLVPELSNLLLATEQLPEYRQTFLSTLNVLLRLRGARPEMRLTVEQLAKINQPTMIIWGRDDPFGSPEVGKRMMRAMPNAELRIVGGAHAPWLRQAEPISTIVTQFLNKPE